MCEPTTTNRQQYEVIEVGEKEQPTSRISQTCNKVVGITVGVIGVGAFCTGMGLLARGAIADDRLTSVRMLLGLFLVLVGMCCLCFAVLIYRKLC